MIDLAKQLRDAARKSGMSMLALSQRAGVPYAGIHTFMVKEGGLTLTTASRLAELLGLELRPVRRRKGK